jgi:hypothetical protein
MRKIVIAHTCIATIVNFGVNKTGQIMKCAWKTQLKHKDGTNVQQGWTGSPAGSAAGGWPIRECACALFLW